MSDEPDILEAYPDLLDIVYRRKQYLAERKGKIFNTQWADDVATLLDAIRSLIQQTRDLRADEGELNYEVYPVYNSLDGQMRQHEPCASLPTIQEARDAAANDRKFCTKHRTAIPVAYQIVAVRRRVVQTVTGG